MNILLVDDEPSFRIVVGDYLVEQGFSVSFAGDGEEGIKKLIQETVDIVISDLYMHAMDGLKFCESARALPGFADLPFLFVSAYGDESTLGTIRSFKNTAFLKKGSSTGEVISQIEYLTTPVEQGGGFSPSQATKTAPATLPKEDALTPVDTGTIRKEPGEYLLLVVDDDDALRLTLRDTLADEGYTVSAAADGYEAMELIQKIKFDLVLTDIVMPNVSGFEVLTFVKEKTPETKVIMITGFTDLKLAMEAKKLGATDFIAKPFMRDDLLRTIKVVLAS